MIASEKGLNRLLEGVNLIKNIQPNNTSSFSVSEWIQSCYEAMNDDFNTPILIANLFEGIRFINLLNDNSATLTAEDLQQFRQSICSFTFDVLGLKDEKSIENNNEKLEGVVNMLIGMRNEARANKDFAMSDQIRNQLIALGIQLKDGKEGTTFSVQ
jgi:cysteinyl-tRNA synthetase